MQEEEGDVTRIIGQIVTNVGFLGAGIIFKDGATIHGLTTAATIWCSAAIGSLIGATLYIPALTATVTVVLINTLLRPLGRWINRK